MKRIVDTLPKRARPTRVSKETYILLACLNLQNRNYYAIAYLLFI